MYIEISNDFSNELAVEFVGPGYYIHAVESCRFDDRNGLKFTIELIEDETSGQDQQTPVVDSGHNNSRLYGVRNFGATRTQGPAVEFSNRR